MFLEFYKLREQPFGVTPDPRYLYLGNAHRKALGSLLYSIQTKRGFSALIAEPGMGKTSLLHQILESLQDSARTAFLFQTVGDSRDLLRCLLYDLAIKCASEDSGVMRETLNANLLQELRSGKQVVVVIDEAQNLDGKILETIRQLSNFETTKQKLMHIVLAGQPGLGAKLSDGSMTQLRQRISTIVRLEPFRDEEIAEYVNHRLQVAGLDGPSMFAPDALTLIGRVSQGIPRNINNLCFQALSVGYAKQAAEIDLPIVRGVASELQLITPSASRPARRPLAPLPVAASPHSALSRQSEPVHLAEFARLGAWETTLPGPVRSSRIKWLAGLACLAALPAAVIALSDTRFGLSDTLPGQISERVMSAVLGTANRNSAPLVPEWPDKSTDKSPDKSKDPAPPASTASPEGSSSSPASSDQATAAGNETRGGASSNLDAIQPNRDASNSSASTKAETKTNEERENAKRVKPEADSLMARNESHGRSHAGAIRDMPTTVQILRPETVFQLAVELYGHSNWIIVEALCAANPEIRDPYTVLRVGETIHLPTDLVTVTQDYNSRSALRRSR